MTVKIISVCILLSIYLTCLETRQMCLQCQFQSPVETYKDAKNKECISGSHNWTAEGIHVRCPHTCYINARFDADTFIPTFWFRGCIESDAGQESGCVLQEKFIVCNHFCGDGADYCNNQTSFKGLKDISDKKEEDDDTDSRDDMTASLYCLMAIIAVCATGYFFKKKYCTNPWDVEEGGVS